MKGNIEFPCLEFAVDNEKCGGGGKIKEMSEKWLDCGRTKRRYLCANDMTAFFFFFNNGYLHIL